jgi:hypothetical protein
VRIIRTADEDEAAAAFVRAELESPRFREEVLAGTRGWRMGGLFDGFPDDIAWFRAALTPDEVLAIRYIDWDWWQRISDGTLVATVAAERIRSGLVPGVTVETHEPIAARLRDGTAHELIVVCPPERDPLVLVEGHFRLTSYALFPEYLPGELELFLGESPRIEEWCQV